MFIVNNVKEQQTLYEIFISQKLQPMVANQLIKQMIHWELHHGTKWLVNRLKLMKAYLLSGEKDSSLACHSDGTFKGAFRHVSRIAQRNRKGSIRADRILRIYGRWESAPLTNQDYLDFKTSVELDPEEDRKVPLWIPKRILQRGRELSRHVPFNLALPTSKTKRVPFLTKSEYETHPLEHFHILQEQCPNLLRKHLNFFQDHIFRVDYIHEDYDLSFGSHWDPGQDMLQFDVAGKIAGLTKDRGLKKRFIANPHRLLQLATSRLQTAADRLLQSLEVSLVHNQSLSEDWIKDQLGKGKKIWSLDLSSATDNFPMWYQEKTVRRLFPELEEDIDLWVDICSLLWELPIKDADKDKELAEQFSHLSPSLVPKWSEEVRYTKGQPMGTAPSFAVFTLSHIMLVFSLGGTNDDFRVVGDDIVISDEILANKYQDYMKTLGVAISATKSIFKSTRAEFAGRTIDKHGFWPSFKSSPINFEKDPFGPYRQFGMRGARFIPKSKRTMMNRLAQIPGLGPKHCWNIKVLNDYDERALLDIFQLSTDPYPAYGIRPVDMFRSYQASGDTQNLILKEPTKAFSLFEESQHSSAGFLGVIGNNKNVAPIFVEHINKMLSDDLSPLREEVLQYWTRNLDRGKDLYRFTESRLPISFLRKVDKILTKWELPQVNSV